MKIYNCPVYDTKQSDDRAPVMLEFWVNSEHSFAIAPIAHSHPE